MILWKSETPVSFSVGMKIAKENGYANVMTGDGGDELFAGYNYLRRYFSNVVNLDAELPEALG